MILARWCLFLLPLLALTTVSCSEYNKILKSTDLDYKYEKAVEYYMAEDYIKSVTLFEELRVLIVGTAKAEKINYYYAKSHYFLQDYYLAAYFLKQFSRTYVNSEHAEECAFLGALCHYRNSPKFSLDQEDTELAIQEMQLFMNRYPASNLVDSCNNLIDGMRLKLEEKSFALSKQYFHMQNYKAAVVAFENTLNDFPNTQYREEILFLTLQSRYELAINSIPSKKEERLRETIKSYRTFANAFDKSKFSREAESILRVAERELEKF